jgi:hypothetical protein
MLRALGTVHLVIDVQYVTRLDVAPRCVNQVTGANYQATSPKPSAVRQSPKPMNLTVKKPGVVQQNPINHF